jgi:hypothetical protein
MKWKAKVSPTILKRAQEDGEAAQTGGLSF